MPGFRQLVAAGKAPPAIQRQLEAELAIENGLDDPVHQHRMLDRNGTLAHGTGLPAVTFPGGFSPLS